MTDHTLEVSVKIQPDDSNKQTATEMGKDFLDYFKEPWENADDFVYTTFKTQADALFEDIGEAWDKTTGSWGDTAGDAISGSLSAIFSGEMDDLDEIWDNAWDEMGDSLESLWDSVLDSLLDRFLGFMGELGKNFILDPLAGWGGDLLGNALGIDSSILFDPAALLKDIFGGIFGGSDLPSGMDSVLGDMFAGMDISDLFADFGLSDMLGESGLGDMLSGMDSALGDMFAGMDLGFTDLAGSVTELFGGLETGISDALGGITDLFGGGGDLLSGLEGLLGGSGGLSALLGGAGILGGVELFAGLTGMPGPIEGITNALGEILGFSDGGGYTPEEAREVINSDLEYFGRATQAMQESLAAGGPNSTVFVEQMRDLAIHIERIADIAGYSQEELDAMVESLGPWGAAMVETSQVSALMNEELGNMILRFQGMGGEMAFTMESEEELRGSLMAMVEALAASGLEVESLGERVDGLAGEFLTGQISAEELAAGLDEAFLTALTEAAAQGEISAEQMRELAEAIKTIPTMTTAEVHTYYVNHHSDVYDDTDGGGGEEERHMGGLVLHQGGMVAPRYHAGSLVSSLAADEVPIIARRGEYVVRAESVTAGTLPWLQALNQTGAGHPGAAASAPQVNLHVEVHGNMLGNEEDLEELARLIGGKLEELERYRHRAA